MIEQRKSRGGVFDIGGVLAHDVWESMYLHPDRGIASQHHLDTAELTRIGQQLWRMFDTAPSRQACAHPEVIERAYWQAFVDQVSAVFGQTLNVSDLIDLTDSFITPVPEMIEILAKMKESGTPVALCSNNNVFWFSRQWEKCGLQRFLDAGNAILSCDEGVSKSHPTGLMFRRAIGVTNLDRSKLLYIDDRIENLELAKGHQLHTTVFELGSDEIDKQVARIRHFLLGDQGFFDEYWGQPLHKTLYHLHQTRGRFTH